MEANQATVFEQLALVSAKGQKISPPDTIYAGYFNLDTGLGLIFNGGVIIALALFVILVVAGGIQYLAAGGNEEETTKARRLLTSSVVGLVAILGTWAITTFIFRFLGYGF